MAINSAIEYGSIAHKFEKIKDELASRYKTDRTTAFTEGLSTGSIDFTEGDFGRKKFKSELRYEKKNKVYF